MVPDSLKRRDSLWPGIRQREASCAGRSMADLVVRPVPNLWLALHAKLT